MIHSHTCFSAVCDACGEPLRDPDSEAEVHFDTEAEARRVARAFRWPVTSGALICPTEDRQHQAAIDALMPAEPAASTQPALPDPVCGWSLGICSPCRGGPACGAPASTNPKDAT